MMKRAGVLLAATALIAFGGIQPGRAADIVAPVETGFTWSGLYVGAQAGYAWANENDNLSDLFDESIASADHFDMNGLLGGIYAGANWQTTSNWVLGVEGDISWTGLDGSRDYDGITDFGIVSFEDIGTLSMNIDWEASLLLRAGYAMDRNLVYVTGGFSAARATLNDSGDGYVCGIIGLCGALGPYDNSDKQTLTGWTIGLGLDHAFTDHLIGRLEARYTDFGSKTFDFGDYNVDAGFKQTQVTVGISYKF